MTKRVTLVPGSLYRIQTEILSIEDLEDSHQIITPIRSLFMVVEVRPWDGRRSAREIVVLHKKGIGLMRLWSNLHEIEPA